MTPNSHYILRLFILVLAWTVQTLPAISQTINDNSCVQSNTERTDTQTENITPVIFQSGDAGVQPDVLLQTMLMAPVLHSPLPALAPPAPHAPPAVALEKLAVTRMNGEVQLKHRQGPHNEPSRALYIETGKGTTSWCECKMQDCTGRIWRDSQVTVFPDTGVLYLEKGALIVKVNKAAAQKYTVIAGDILCRVHGPASTVHVFRNTGGVKVQVLEGNAVTVYNRQTGEIVPPEIISRPTR